MADRLTQIASKPSIRDSEESTDLDKSEESTEDVSLPPIKGVRNESPLK
ncbi:jg148, partial [Pararge aegeria aegeria]